MRLNEIWVFTLLFVFLFTGYSIFNFINLYCTRVLYSTYLIKI